MTGAGTAIAHQLIVLESEDELRACVRGLNENGIATHIGIMDANGHSVLASLTGCYAEGLAYYSPGEDGYMHCCDCAECGPVCQERNEAWKRPVCEVNAGLPSGDFQLRYRNIGMARSAEARNEGCGQP